MRLAYKKNSTTGNSILKDYYLVSDNYDFASNYAVDKTSPSSLEAFYENGDIEYGVLRTSLESIFVPAWNNLSFSEKRICVKYYKYPAGITQEEFNSYFTASEHEANWNLVTKNSREKQRLKRLFAAFSKVSYTMTPVQVSMVYLVTKELCYDYYYANIPNLIFWVLNGVSPLGNDYTNNGFAQMDGYTTALRDQIVDILVNGNYVYKD